MTIRTRATAPATTARRPVRHHAPSADIDLMLFDRQLWLTAATAHALPALTAPGHHTALAWTGTRYENLVLAQPPRALLASLSTLPAGTTASARSAPWIRLLRLAADLTAARAVVCDPGRAGGNERYRPAPDRGQYSQMRDLLEEAAARQGVSAAGGWRPARAWFDDVVADLTAAWPAVLAPLPGTPRGKVARRRHAEWAEQIIARAGAGARLALQLEPTDGQWHVSVVALADRAGDDGAPTDPVVADLPAADGRIDLDGLARQLDCHPSAALALVRADGGALAAAYDHLARHLRPSPEPLFALVTGPRGLAGAQAIDHRNWSGYLQPGPHPLPAGKLDEIIASVDALASRGIEVRVPGGAIRPAGTLTARLTRSGSGGPAAGMLSRDRLALTAAVQVDGVELDADTLARLADDPTSLVQIGTSWVRLTADQAHVLGRLARAERDGAHVSDLLVEPAFDGVDIDPDLFATPVAPRRVPVPAGFTGTLRPYQRAGLDWLVWLEDNSVGGIFADQMGLGKAVTGCALIAHDHAGPTLVVATMSLVTNWANELARFTPGLRVHVHHGPDRGERTHALADADVVLTTYELLVRDDYLAHTAWHRVIVDEAQKVKNPDSAAARAVRALPRAHTVVMTGTPVENHLGDLWTLMGYAVPGLLGSRTAFTRAYADKPSLTETERARLRAVIAPFILRRLKTDPDVVPDLPGRTTDTVACPLTPEQVRAYTAIEKAANAELAEATGMSRRSCILTTIMRLKQACVHPLLLPGGAGTVDGRSGKVAACAQIAADAINNDEAVLVFTQFASFVPDLAAHLSAELGVPVLQFHGGMSKRARDTAVAAFAAPDGPPVMVISLKAGGVGLNLTRANHVVHLDRWWNPAVEDQASDRAWRIGQTKPVTVHVLHTPGTLEERIAEVLDVKRTLADSVVDATDLELTEMSDEQFAAFIALDPGALL